MIAAERKTLSIAIDGPAGAGKSTVARRVADALGYIYIDTGAMYRAVAWAVVKQRIAPEDAPAVAALAQTLRIVLHPDADGEGTRVSANDEDITNAIRTPEISSLTSPLSAIPAVREHLVKLQQEMGARGCVVMEGRDIGTVVLPQAEIKVFLTASLAERARRRQAELTARGITVAFNSLERDIAERDARDGSRDIAPMRPAPDAVILDSDTLSADEVLAQILALHKTAMERRHAE